MVGVEQLGRRDANVLPDILALDVSLRATIGVAWLYH